MMYTSKYPIQTITADAVCFFDGEVLLVKRNTEPFKGKYALPGGHLDPEDETTLDAAKRELKEETGIDVDQPIMLKAPTQLGAYDKIGRDPRGRYISVAYLFILSHKPELKIQEDEVQSAVWIKIEDLIKQRETIAFDHYRIIVDSLMS